MPRKDDLERSIHVSYDIIREYVDIIQTSVRPEERKRAQGEIDRQWDLVDGYLVGYRAIVGDVLPDEIAQIAAHFTALAEWSKVEQAISGQEGLRGTVPDEQIDGTLAGLRDKQASILARLGGSGAIARDHSVAAGKGGAAVGRDVGGDVIVAGEGSTVIVGEAPVALTAFTLQRGGETSWQTYKDFVLEIGRASKGTYSIKVQGPTGEARATFSRPVDEKDLKIFLLEVGRPQRIAIRGRVPKPMQQTVDFGAKLYNAVFSGDVRDTFVSARHDARRGDCGLRIKLRLTDVPELADIPWEFLYDGHDFLALSTDTPLVRYLDLPRPPRPMQVELPLRVLVTISAPHDWTELSVEAEQARVREALEGMVAQGMAEVEYMTNVTLSTLQRTLRRAKRNGRPYHIWHYIGHGTFDRATQSSVLVFCNRDGRSSLVSGFQLGTLFSGYPEIRLALLNACEGARADVQDPFAGVAAALVERGVPAVIGMQFEISNEAATVFAEEFYTSIVDGLPVDAAVTEARRGVFFIPNWVEWATPVLYMRAPDGVLFDVQERVETERATKKEIKARERKESEQRERKEDERKAREKAEREAQKKAERRAKKEAKLKEEKEKALPTVLSPRRSLEPEMIFIPAGEFLMGSGSDQHTLYLPDYYIAKTPVTNAQYAAFVQTTGSSVPENKEDHPVVNVSWYDATKYCQWLAEVTGKIYRLPSEAEWEKAARGTDGRIYPWGDEWDASRCNTSKGGKRGTTPVGTYPQGASPYGCLDMAGNVWEWTRSLYKNYPYDPTDGREDLDAGGRRVVRGGSWGDLRGLARCADRGWDGPVDRGSNRGFRLVVSPIS